MSREVDPNSSNLSTDDKIYLIQRGQMPTSVMSVEEQRKLVDPDSNTLALEDRANTGDVNTSSLSIDELEELLAARRAEQDAVDPASLFGSQSGPADDDDDDDDEVVAPYDQYSKATLYAEVQRRNEDRDDEDKIVVPAPGNKPEYVTALEEDDEE